MQGAGLKEYPISKEIADGSRCAASDMVAEARGNGYDTTVMGRRGLSGVKEPLLGNVTSKVLQDWAGIAAWIAL